MFFISSSYQIICKDSIIKNHGLTMQKEVGMMGEGKGQKFSNCIIAFSFFFLSFFNRHDIIWSEELQIFKGRVCLKDLITVPNLHS